jgi:hypothetical protein
MAVRKQNIFQPRKKEIIKIKKGFSTYRDISYKHSIDNMKQNIDCNSERIGTSNSPQQKERF